MSADRLKNYINYQFVQNCHNYNNDNYYYSYTISEFRNVARNKSTYNTENCDKYHQSFTKTIKSINPIYKL